jgi:hypothetical protein
MREERERLKECNEVMQNRCQGRKENNNFI